MTNHRTPCPYCKTTVLTNSYGKHLFSKHETILFDKNSDDGATNYITLWKAKYEKDPIALCIKGDTYYCCLSDYSVIKRLNLAQKHYSQNKQAHHDNLIKLREKYPKDSGVDDSKEGSLSPAVIDAIQQVVWTLMDRIRHDEFMTNKPTTPDLLYKVQKVIPLIPFTVKESILKQKFDPDEEEEEEKPVSQEPTPEESITPPIQETPVDLPVPEESIPPPIQEIPVIEEPPVPRVSKRQPKRSVIPIPKQEETPKLQEETPPPPPPVKIPQLIQSQPTYIPQKVQPQTIPIIKNTKQEKQVKPTLTIPPDLEKELSRMTPQQRQIFLQVMTQKDIDTLTQRY